MGQIWTTPKERPFDWNQRPADISSAEWWNTPKRDRRKYWEDALKPAPPETPAAAAELSSTDCGSDSDRGIPGLDDSSSAIEDVVEDEETSSTGHFPESCAGSQCDPSEMPDIPTSDDEDWDPADEWEEELHDDDPYLCWLRNKACVTNCKVALK